MAETSLRFHIQSAPALAELGGWWRALEARADITFFLSWDWIGTWLAEHGAPPDVLVGEVGGTPVLLGIVVPRRRSDAALIRMDGIYLHTTGDRDLDMIAMEYNDFLVDRAWTGRAERAAVEFLLNHAEIGGRRRDELHIVATLDSARERLVPPGMLIQVPSRKPSWRVDLDALRMSGRSYLATLSANTRQQVRRSMRLYEQGGALTATRATDVPTALAFLHGLSELHQRQWTARGKPGGFSFPFFARFQRRLVETCIPHGTVEITRVAQGTTPIGYVYNLMLRGHVLAFVTGFRYDDDPRLKPGLVCHTLCIERHLEEGAHAYDFLAGDARYKRNLGRPGPEFIYLLIQRPTAMTRLEHMLRRAWETVRPPA